jgi:hypothetical protein
MNTKTELKHQGFSILLHKDAHHSLWREQLYPFANELTAFKQSWQDLPPDDFLQDGGHYRYRRYAVFSWDATTENKEQQLTLLPHEPHYQTTYRNAMNGGIYRDFAPFKTSTLKNPILDNIIHWCVESISLKQEKNWRIQAHQFRIKANSNEAGKPTPEGIHKDGADFVLIMLIQRNNITGGVSHLYDNDKKLQFGAVLETCGDAILIDDRKVWHGVSEVYALDETNSGYRDVLVLTFHKEVLK